jgi:hypothetical protein
MEGGSPCPVSAMPPANQPDPCMVSMLRVKCTDSTQLDGC